MNEVKVGLSQRGENPFRLIILSSFKLTSIKLSSICFAWLQLRCLKFDSLGLSWLVLFLVVLSSPVFWDARLFHGGDER